jgi:hypothetical protein
VPRKVVDRFGVRGSIGCVANDGRILSGSQEIVAPVDLLFFYLLSNFLSWTSF